LLILSVRSLSSADLTSQNDSDQNFGFSRSKPLMHQGIRFPVLPFSSRPSRLRSTTALVYVAACVLACAAGGCGSTVATSTGPSPAKCAVTLTAPDAVTGGGATATVAVATQPECAWSASSEVVWITGLTPASGQGSGQLQMRVAANPNTSARQGDIVVNGERAHIRQDAAPCSFELSAVEQTISASGGTGTITVTTAATCAWTAQSDATWAVITTGAAGTGTASVNFTIAPNTGSARTASLVIADQMVKVTQEAVAPVDCSYTVSARNVSAPASGTDASSVSVTAPPRCKWLATSNSSWISVTGSTASSGNGTVTFSISPNPGAARTGTLTVANQTVTVNQAAVPCSYSVTPTNVSIEPAGGTGTPISVSTLSGCAWTSASHVSWVTILSGASSTGGGSVTYSVQPNTGAARNGTLTVAGQTVTISQATCTYAIAPTSQTFNAFGASGGPVAVTTQPGCAWTAVSKASWITETAGSSVSGSGTVTFRVAANTGRDRTGTLTIAGLTFTVTQKEEE
jgi:Putative binding domain, N-terminal/Viral BACON domain